MSCLRCAAGLLTKPLVGDGIIGLASPLVQSARGIKPRWLPKSKSKIFYVRQPTPRNAEEDEQLKTLYSHHRAHLRSIRNFLCKEHRAQVEAAKQLSIKQHDKNLEFKTMEDQVSQWNARVSLVREENQMVEVEKKKKLLEKKVARHEQRQLERLEKAEQKLQRDIEESSKFITMDNLDTEIEKLLNMRTDYNFAIDKMGNRISADTPALKDSQQKSSEPDQQAQTAKG